MKNLQKLSWTILILTLLVMGASAFVPLPDWAVRADGIVMLLVLLLAVFTTVQNVMKS